MNKNRKKRTTAADALVVLLFFGGVALIAAGLWLASKPLSLVFLGISALYVSACVSKSANSPERTVKK